MNRSLPTEDEHQRRGLGRHVLTIGFALLSQARAQRIELAYDPDNASARRLYHWRLRLTAGVRGDVPPRMTRGLLAHIAGV